MQLTFTPTPARSAHLGSAIDRRDPRVTTSTALGLIIAVYLLFFAEGIVRGIHAYRSGSGGGFEDYSTPFGHVVLARTIVEVFGVATIFYLVCRWLGIPRGLAGIPRRRTEAVALSDRRALAPSSWPVMFTAGVVLFGFVGSFAVSGLLTPSDSSITATNMSLADNGISLLGAALRSLNAGVVEEIVIVALPVLLGRRAGWHPVCIVALSVILRWPFHLYHGLWSTIPWVTVWAGCNAAAYLYLRRLWPLIIIHTSQDLLAFYANTSTAYLIVTCAVIALLAAALVALLIGNRRRDRTTTIAGQDVRYRRLPDNTVRIISPAPEKIPDIWQAITALRTDIGSRRARLRLELGPRSRHARTLRRHGYPCHRWGVTWIPLDPTTGRDNTVEQPTPHGSPPGRRAAPPHERGNSRPPDSAESPHN